MGTTNVGEFSGDLSPEAPHGSAQGVGDLVFPDSSGDVHPQPPSGESVNPTGWAGNPDASGLVEPSAPIVDGKTMPLNKGRTTGSL